MRIEELRKVIAAADWSDPRYKNIAEGLIELWDAIQYRVDVNQYPDTGLHAELCASLHATMACTCGADAVYKALEKLREIE